MPGNIGSTGFRGSVKPLALMMTALSKRPFVSGEADRNFVLRPEQHHVVRVAAELGDVGLHPLQGLDLVQGAPVAGGMLRILGRDLRMGEEAERAHAVVERDQDHVLGRELLAVELRLGAPAFAEAAAEDPHAHRQLLVRLAGRLGPYVQIQAVLAVRGLGAVSPLGGVAAGVVRGLERRMAEGVARADAFPRHDRLRLLPAELAEWRGGVRNAAVDGDAGKVGRDALDLAALDGEDGAVDGLLGAGRKGQGARKDQDSFHGIGVFFLPKIRLLRKIIRKKAYLRI